MSLLDQLLTAATITDTEHHVEPVTYEYEKDGKKETITLDVGVVKRIPMANNSNMEMLNSLQASPASARIAQMIVFLEGDRRKLTPTEVDNLDMKLTAEFMRIIHKHHPEFFPNAETDEEEKPAKKAKKN